MKKNNVKIAVVGLGYVGLPLTIEFSRYFPVVGYDLDNKRIKELLTGYDKTKELTKNQLANIKNLDFVSSLDAIKDSNIYIITVPTPVNKNNIPDLEPLKNASTAIGSIISKNDLVIYESTVFPGATENVCVPILETQSKLKYKEEFFCGYSPERINPGDKKHSLANTIKITSGCDIETAQFVNWLYSKIVKAGTHSVQSIEIAETAKVIENVQRDVNIALMNELSIIFNKLGLDTEDILNAASTKWNFLPFKPGLVGGHCIGVDPYYLTHRAVELGYHPEMILAGRKINDSMGFYIAEKTVAELTKQNINLIDTRIGILGLTFKENCSDIRNTKVIDIINQLRLYKCKLYITDEWVDKDDAKKELNVDLIELHEIKGCDAIILAVAHDSFKNFTTAQWKTMINDDGVVIDVKSLYKKDTFDGTAIKHWRL
tara:strand:+ start:232 stop:1524 length:1293 start_codon:yes stop_codon:yes gene_type:complete